MTSPETAVLVRIRQMADYWEQHLPEVIRTPAVVSAIRAALESAAVEFPADRTALRDRIAEAALAAVEAALGDTLLPAAREEALAGIVAVLPAPADRAAVLREAADAVAAHPGPIAIADGRGRDVVAAARAYLDGVWT